MGALDAFQPRSPAEERAQLLGDAPCSDCTEIVYRDHLDAAGRCPECAADHQAELDVDDPASDLSQELTAHYDDLRAAYDHELVELLPWHMGWEGAAA